MHTSLKARTEICLNTHTFSKTMKFFIIPLYFIVTILHLQTQIHTQAVNQCNIALLEAQN